MRTALVRAVSVLAVVAAGAGCHRFGSDASIAYMSSVIGSPDSRIVECWLEVAFGELDPRLDPRDVEIRLESVALVEPVVYDWDFIAARDTTERAIVAPENRATHPADPPAPGTRTNIRVRAEVLPGIASREVVYLYARLSWGGVEQDSDRRSLAHVFAAELR